MKRFQLVITLMIALSICTIVPVSAMAADTFVISQGSMKIAEGSYGGWVPTYGPGKNIAIKNNEVYVGVAYNKDWSSTPVSVGIVNSSDYGETWERVWDIDESSDYNGNGAHIALTNSPSNNRVKAHLVWGGWSNNSIYYADTYGSGILIVNGPEHADVYGRSIAADNSTGVHIIYDGQDSQYHTRIYYSRLSYNSGTGHFEIAEAGAEISACSSTYGCGDAPDITVDGNGVPFAIWSEYDSSDINHLYVSKRISGSWTSPTAIEGSFEPYGYSAIAASGSKVCAVWTYWDYGTSATAIAATCSSDGSNWDTPKEVSTDDPQDRADIAVNSNGTPAVVWTVYDSSTQTTYLKYSVYSGNNWSNAPEVIDTPKGGYDPSIAADGSNKFHVVYPSKGWTVMQYSHQ